MARIRVADDELDRLAAELSNIIGWVEQLSEVNVEGVEPMTSVVDMALPTRQDLVTDGGYAERVTANAPQSQDGFFLVPKVIE
ncbi:MAG TPA: Asp-tRNA(Asn)/Glu-tRNA(Gln) amidotransferase subunit GatC [Alphaproteobacteria bacterium]|nr:Asp-tRNA(Asn)/Glu-tRNA(Gln) amidotransferase subunit GatC [Alphaproteobacteria bacterium]